MVKKKEVIEEPLEKRLWKAADKLRSRPLKRHLDTD